MKEHTADHFCYQSKIGTISSNIIILGTQTPQPEQIAQLPTMQDIALYGKQLRYLQTKNWINCKSYRQLSKLLKARKKSLLNAN